MIFLQNQKPKTKNQKPKTKNQKPKQCAKSFGAKVCCMKEE
jgi:murein endopeptidase